MACKEKGDVVLNAHLLQDCGNKLMKGKIDLCQKSILNAHCITL